MYKVLIVDDNIIIRKSIIARVNWNEIDMEIVGEASNGKEAYDLICNNKIDIVITDIKMPEIDGLSLIEKTKPKFPNLQYIIISSFDDFKYTKKAILYKVVTYILKPVNNHELLTALNTSKQNIIQLKEQSTQKINMKFTRELQEFNQLNNSVLTYLHDNDSTNDSDLIGSLYKNSYDKFVVITVNTVSNILTNNHVYAIYKQIHRKKLDLFFIRITEHVFIIILTSNAIDTLVIDKLIFETKKTLHKMNMENIYFSCSSIVDSVEKLKSSYKESLNAQFYRFLTINSTNGVYYYRKIDSDFLFDDELNNYKLALDLGAKKQAIDTIDHIFLNLKNHQVNSFILKFIMRSIINNINNTLLSCNLDKGILQDKVFDRYFFLSFNSLNEIHNFFIELTTNICNNIKHNNIDGHDKITDYIKSNYTKSITLNLMAEKFYMNTNYLGQLIKKETGQTFNQFINSLRIEQAKNILSKQPDMKLNELAHSIGYADSQYFSKVFRKICGCTPTQYKSR